MRKTIQTLLLCLIGFTAFSQSEIALTYEGKPISKNEGINLKEVNYPLVRLALIGKWNEESNQLRLEATLIRHGRAVRSMRCVVSRQRNGDLQELLRSARSGDDIMITAKDPFEGLGNRVVRYPVR